VKPEAERRVFRTRGGLALVADAYGDPLARPVVLAHGGGQTRHAWGGAATALSRRGWYALALDLRGHGESDWSPDGDYEFGVFADDLRDVSASLTQPPVLVGASLGGLAALLAQGEARPDVFSAVVLVDVTPRMEPTGVERIRGFMSEHLERGFATLDEAADAVAAYQPQRVRERNLAGLEKNLRRGDDGRWRWHWDPRFMERRSRLPPELTVPRFSAAARNLRVPALLVRGRMSELVSEEAAREFLELVPHARYVDVSGAGHMVAGDRNDIFSDAVIGFLSDLSADSASS
jgi:pimeloyl-ACP methyl ester carboxylesterase